MPRVRLKGKTLREPPVTPLDFMLLSLRLTRVRDIEGRPTRAELAAALRRGLAAWAEDPEAVHLATEIARWCADFGVETPRWAAVPAAQWYMCKGFEVPVSIKAALGGKLPPVLPPEDPDEDTQDPLGELIKRRRKLAEDNPS